MENRIIQFNSTIYLCLFVASWVHKIYRRINKEFTMWYIFTYYHWYIFRKMDFSLHITSQVSPTMWYCSEISILTKQINDSIFLYHIFLQVQKTRIKYQMNKQTGTQPTMKQDIHWWHTSQRRLRPSTK